MHFVAGALRSQKGALLVSLREKNALENGPEIRGSPNVKVAVYR